MTCWRSMAFSARRAARERNRPTRARSRLVAISRIIAAEYQQALGERGPVARWPPRHDQSLGHGRKKHVPAQTLGFSVLNRVFAADTSSVQKAPIVSRLTKQGREIPHRGPRSHPDVGIALPTFLPFSSTRLP